MERSKAQRKVKKIKEPAFGKELTSEHLSFEKLTLKEKLFLLTSDLLRISELALDRLYHPHSLEPLPIAFGAKRTMYNLVSRSLKVGEIEKVVEGGKVIIRTTAKGEEYITREFPILRWQGVPWDGLWRMVTYDIPEEERETRDLLREKLKELGFGLLQLSLWISPRDIVKPLREFLESEGLQNEVFVLEAKRLFAGDERFLAAQIWPLGELNVAYKAWIKKARKKKKDLPALKEEYLAILKADPYLPKELLPFDWQGDAALKLFRKL